MAALSRPPSALALFFLFATLLLLAHAPFLGLPFYWDELGYFVPAALDLFHQGAWVPRSTLANVHPPGLMAYLAAVWSLAGYSIWITRVAMLLLAAAGLVAAFLLARSLHAPPWVATAFLCVSPLLFAQSMLAQLDLPAMLFTTLALALFLEEKPAASALACTALVLVKETGILVALVLGGWLLYERRARHAAWFLAPPAALAAWLLLLSRQTGCLLGNPEFARYNVSYLWNPVRAAVALARRLYLLFFQDFHWIGTLALMGPGRRLLAERRWRIAGLLVGAHVVAFSLFGGAVLERYLLPVLPMLYAAMAAAFAHYHLRWRIVAGAALLAGLVAGNFWNPPYPFPLENNLAFTDFVALQRTAANFVSSRYPSQRVTTAWPLSDALVRPELGYVAQPVPVRALPDFRVSTLRGLQFAPDEVVVQFSRGWNPRWSLIQWEPARRLWTRYFDYQPDASLAGLHPELPLAARWSRRGQWIAVWTGAPREP